MRIFAHRGFIEGPEHGMDNHLKWSYAKYNSEGRVTEVAEKVVISDQATVGIYYFRKGKNFIKYARRMIEKNVRVNNEFYVCPVFNQFIEDGCAIYIHKIEKERMHGMGTPEDLETTAEHLKKE